MSHDWQKVKDTKYYKQRWTGLIFHYLVRGGPDWIGGAAWPCKLKGSVAQELYFLCQSINLLFMILGIYSFELRLCVNSLVHSTSCFMSRCIFTHFAHLEPVCCKKQQKNSWPVTGLRNRGPLKDLNDSKLIVYESKGFPWSSGINFIPFRIFRGPLFHKPVTGQELFFDVCYSKPALVIY